MLGSIVGRVIHAITQGDICAFGWGRDKNFFCPAGEMHGSFITIGKQTAAFEHDVNIERFPGQLPRVTFLQNLDAFAVDDKGVFFRFHFSVESSVNGIVLQQMRQRFCIGDVVDRDKIKSGFFEARPQRVAPDTAKAVDAYSYRHSFLTYADEIYFPSFLIKQNPSREGGFVAQRIDSLRFLHVLLLHDTIKVEMVASLEDAVSMDDVGTS